MNFYKIKEDRIIDLATIRTAQVYENEIYLSYTCGDTRSERITFCNSQAASDTFDSLCEILGVR